MAKKKKVNYWLPLEVSMWDMCHCCSKCSTPCGRQKPPVEQIATCSDFGAHCSQFKPLKEE